MSPDQMIVSNPKAIHSQLKTMNRTHGVWCSGSMLDLQVRLTREHRWEEAQKPKLSKIDLWAITMRAIDYSTSFQNLLLLNTSVLHASLHGKITQKFSFFFWYKISTTKEKQFLDWLWSCLSTKNCFIHSQPKTVLELCLSTKNQLKFVVFVNQKLFCQPKN